jgi:hypothetical protein
MSNLWSIHWKHVVHYSGTLQQYEYVFVEIAKASKLDANSTITTIVVMRKVCVCEASCGCGQTIGTINEWWTSPLGNLQYQTC